MEALINLTAVLTNPNTDGMVKLKKICSTAADVIPGADLVSIWTFDEAMTAITCKMRYQRTNREFSGGMVLKREDAPAYFDAIVNQDVISASDARQHQYTSEFTEHYFIPNSIYSLLDFILHKNFEPKGVICCEATGSRYHWTDEDIDSIKRIARASSLYLTD